MGASEVAISSQDARTEGALGQLVLAFLAALEARELELAAASLGADATLVFPGGRHYHAIEPLVADAADRYRSVVKRIDAVETLADIGVVYVRGTLAGTNVHGVGFAGVRFVDRFEVRDGRIVRQDVWNDLAESGVLDRRP